MSNDVESPFVPTTTPVIERANRLLAVRAHPGFLDIIRISQEIVNSAVTQCMEYPGWDEKQMVVLTIRQKCAKELHELLWSKINEAIALGVEEAKNATHLPEKNVDEIMEQSDMVRQKVLTTFSEMDTDTRSPGSY